MLMRRECHALNVLLLTTISAARATLEAIRSIRQNALEPIALQDLYQPWKDSGSDGRDPALQERLNVQSGSSVEKPTPTGNS